MTTFSGPTLLEMFLLFASTSAQFYGQNFGLVNPRDVFENKGLHSLYNSLNRQPWLRDPVGSFLNEDFGGNRTSPAEFFCAMVRRLSTPGVGEKCSLGIEDLACALVESGRNANNSESDALWPIEALDSFGKLPSGLLEYDLFWPGDYTQCKNIRVTIDAPGPNDTIIHRDWNGEYAVAHVGLGAECTFVNIGLCVPDTCSNTDLNILFYKLVPASLICPVSFLYREPEKKATWLTYFMTVLLVLTAVLLSFATAFDLIYYQAALALFLTSKSNEPEPYSINSTEAEIVHKNTKKFNQKQDFFDELSWYWRILLAFSVYTNGQKLLSGAEGQLSCVHGIRFLSMAWVMLGHTYFFSAGYLKNLKMIFDLPNQFLFNIVNNATPSVDSFFLLSGFLLSYLFLKRAQTVEGGIKLKTIRFWVVFYVHRYVRLTPLLAVVMGLGYGLWSFTGHGPMWANSDNNGMLNQCPTVWWRNLLYIENMWNYTEQCIGWVWYLANDMQFYWISPPLLLLFYLKPLLGLIAAISLIFGSSFLRIGFILHYHYPPQAMITTDPNKWAAPDYQTRMYSKPWMRIGPYLVGIILGWLVLKTQGKLRMRKFFAIPMWLVTFALSFAVIFGLFPFAKGHDISDFWRALYGGFGRTAWGVVVASTIFLCLNGYGG